MIAKMMKNHIRIWWICLVAISPPKRGTIQAKSFGKNDLLIAEYMPKPVRHCSRKARKVRKYVMLARAL